MAMEIAKVRLSGSILRSIITRKIERNSHAVEKINSPPPYMGAGVKISLCRPLSASKKIRPKTFPNARLGRPMAPPIILAAESAWPINWRGINRRQLPGSWHSMRSALARLSFSRHRNAAHPVNCLLNYAYCRARKEIRLKAFRWLRSTIGIHARGQRRDRRKFLSI